MELTLPILKKMFAEAARDIAAEEQNLCRLDSACGDGDHGVAMRGAIEAASGAVQAASNLKDAFFDAGMAAMANSNGSTSTIYGTLFTGISDALPAGAESLSAAQIASAFEGALASMREVVKGDVGDKTCFDALIPAVRAMKGAADAAGLFSAAAKATDEGAKSTEKLRAKFGRARNLGEKSVGTLDPGAVSNAIMFAAFSRAFGK